MILHLHREIENLKKRIVLLAGTVERQVEDSVRAIERREPQLALLVREKDAEIDMAEIDVEEECLKILALHQPVAIDLRFIVAVMKINNDLERIGDEAVNIAGRGLTIIEHPPYEGRSDLVSTANKVLSMLKRSLDSLVNLDAAAAKAVRDSDDEIDEAVHRLFLRAKEEIRRHPERVDFLIEYVRIFRHLERIADHATNIAEDVIYMIEGAIVRHHHEK